MVESWQTRPLAPVYAMIYLDALHLKLKREDKIASVAVNNVLSIYFGGHREILGHWIGDGAKGANFWFFVITDLQNCGSQDIFLAATDGLSGFKDAEFLKTRVKRCFIRQIRNSLKYVVWKDRKAFMADLKRIYQTATQEKAEVNLIMLEETWGGKYGTAIRSRQKNWAALSTFFEFPQ